MIPVPQFFKGSAISVCRTSPFRKVQQMGLRVVVSPERC